MEQTIIILHRVLVEHDKLMLWVGVPGGELPGASTIFACTDKGTKINAEEVSILEIEPQHCGLETVFSEYPASACKSGRTVTEDSVNKHVERKILSHMKFSVSLEAGSAEISFRRGLLPGAGNAAAEQPQKALPMVPGKYFPLGSCAGTSRYHIKKTSYVIGWGKDRNALRVSRAGAGKRGILAWGEWFAMAGRAFFDSNAGVGVKLSLYNALFKMCYSKKSMIISDRPAAAGDNGEAFCRYMLEHHKEWKVYFAIEPDCEDGRRLKQQGISVIAPGSFLYRMLWLRGAVIASSQGEDWIFAPYGTKNPYVKKYNYNTRFVFLQHGVTKDDQTRWLNAYRKYIRLFVTSTKEEYDSIVNGAYGYSAEEVALTGMPRFDVLHNQPQKRITVMFTWRKSLVEEPDQHGVRVLKPGFEDSTYMEMLGDVLCNDQLLKLLRENGYSVHVKLHPCMAQAVHYLEKMKEIIVDGADISYREIFEKSALIITDYSSTVFDFAYLQKPVLYYQKDRESFFDGTHMYRQGYYDYEKEGFGPVVYSRQELEKQILSLVSWENGKLPAMEACYMKRVEETFSFTDRENCRRVYDAIERML